MLTKRTRLTMLGFLLLGVLLGLFVGYKGGIVIKTSVKEMSLNSKESAKNRAPLKSVTITIQASQRELLFDQLRRFAEKNYFAIRITNLMTSSYHIEMWREDINIFGSMENDDGIFSISFHRNQFEHSITQPVSESVVEELMNDLQSFVSEVPSAITTERRHRLIITTNKDWRNEELLAQMKALAEKHSLEYEFSFYDSDQCLLVEIYGEGFHITTHDCERDTLKDINIDFYLDYHKNPTAQSEEKLDTLLDELRELFGNSDNATVNEEP